jgi:uncharacterized protein YjiS (DUF1127 family)
MTPKHRDLDDLTGRLSAPAALAAPGYGTGATLAYAGLHPRAGLASRTLHALARGAAGLSLWHERARQRCALLELSDYMLCDIGVSRAEAGSEARKPFWRG